MKTCVTCKHYAYHDCKIHPHHHDMVSGTIYYYDARSMRVEGANCGPTGILHEPKPDSFLVRIGKWVLRIK